MFVSRPKSNKVLGCPNKHIDSELHPVIELMNSMNKKCFCPVCGLQVINYVKSEETELVCDVCGDTVNKKWIFCMSCGSKGRIEK